MELYTKRHEHCRNVSDRIHCQKENAHEERKRVMACDMGYVNQSYYHNII